MRCQACGLDNDPALDYCDSCEHPLRDSTAVVSVPPPPIPRPRPAPAVEFDDAGTAADPGFRDTLVEPRPPARPVLVGVAVLALAGAVGGYLLAQDRGDKSGKPDSGAVTSAAARPVGGGTDAARGGATGADDGDGGPGSGDGGPSSGNGGPSSAAADPQAQGAALDKLLDRSRASRDKLNQAIKSVDGCSGVYAAIGRMREAGDERAAERDTLATLDLSAFPNGESLRSALTSAFEHSLAADQNYVKWAQEKQANDCRNTPATRAYDADGDRESDSAGRAKEQFLGLWNPIAGQLGLQTRDRQGI